MLQASREAAFTSFASLGFPDWVIIGSLEIFDGINGGVGAYGHDDFKDITGKEPTTIGQWVEGAVKSGLGVLDPAPAPVVTAPVVAAEVQSAAEGTSAAAPATPTAVEVHASAPEAAPVAAPAPTSA